MNLRAPRGVRFQASSLTSIAGSPAPTGFYAGNKKPDNIIGRGWPGRPVIRCGLILRWAFAKSVHIFP
ncbi:hypothetical protein F7R06_14160 [Pseudomonas moorei]|nr:hypothetical protein F7R06_14160 [Pseudomonas moorei]